MPVGTRALEIKTLSTKYLFCFAPKVSNHYTKLDVCDQQFSNLLQTLARTNLHVRIDFVSAEKTSYLTKKKTEKMTKLLEAITSLENKNNMKFCRKNAIFQSHTEY